jgi:hypothetical protein
MHRILNFLESTRIDLPHRSLEIRSSLARRSKERGGSISRRASKM